MRKKLVTFLITVLIPISTIFAYTDKVYIGGENVGIEVKTDGVLVVGLYKINDNFIQNSVNPGDYIIEVNG